MTWMTENHQHITTNIQLAEMFTHIHSLSDNNTASFPRAGDSWTPALLNQGHPQLFTWPFLVHTVDFLQTKMKAFQSAIVLLIICVSCGKSALYTGLIFIFIYLFIFLPLYGSKAFFFSQATITDYLKSDINPSQCHINQYQQVLHAKYINCYSLPKQLYDFHKWAQVSIAIVAAIFLVSTVRNIPNKKMCLKSGSLFSIMVNV